MAHLYKIYQVVKKLTNISRKLTKASYYSSAEKCMLISTMNLLNALV